MILNRQGILDAIKSSKQSNVWLMYSFDEYLLATTTDKLVDMLTKETGCGATVIQGPIPDVGEAVEAAGAISMFGDKRVVLFSHIQPADIPKEDMELFAELCSEIENAVFIFTVLVKEEKFGFKEPELKLGAAAKPLLAAAEKYGVCAAIEKPNIGSTAAFLENVASNLGAEFEKGAATALISRCGNDLFSLDNETKKLAAATGYTVIDKAIIERLSVRNIEADIFELSKDILAGKGKKALDLLDELIYLKNDPIYISAILIGAFVDIYKSKCGEALSLNSKQIASDLKYKSEYRVKMNLSAASKYSQKQISRCLEILTKMDEDLKSSPMDNAIILQKTICELLSSLKR